MITTDLTKIAATLESLEETIISYLIDRGQYKSNPSAYTPGESSFPGYKDQSLFNIRLQMQEKMDAQFGRYYVPEERPFTTGLPDAERLVILPESPLRISNYNTINLTSEIIPMYFKIRDQICVEGDDGQYGSTVVIDILALQAISRRIHYGAFYVAESKFRSDEATYRKLINDKNQEELMRLLTRPEVEERILIRVGEKARHMQALSNKSVRTIIPEDSIIALYKDYIIPLTKKGELAYLLQR